jgi:hypothetical protein
MNTQKLITGLDVAIRVVLLTSLALMSYRIITMIKKDGDDGDDWKRKRLKPLPTPPPVNKQAVFLIEKTAYKKVNAQEMVSKISEN